MSAAGKQDQMCVRYHGGEQASLVSTYGRIVLAMYNKCRHFHLRKHFCTIAPVMDRTPVASGCFRIRRRPLQLVEMSDHFWIGIFAEKMAGEQLTKSRRVTSPAFPN